MSDDPVQSRLKLVITALVTYLAVTFSLFFYGYWTPFGIDFISYFNLSEFLHVAVFFDLPVLYFLLLVGVLPSLCVVLIKEKDAKASIAVYVGFCVLFVPLVIYSYCGLSTSSVTAMTVVIISSVVVFEHLRHRINQLEKSLKLLPLLLVPGLVGLPFLAYSYSKNKAELILGMTLTEALSEAKDPHPWPLPLPTEMIRGEWNVWSLKYKPFVAVVDVIVGDGSNEDLLFLGRIGDHYFCLNPINKQRLVFRIDGVDKLLVKNLPRHVQRAAD
jgi:hypothetical protein